MDLSFLLGGGGGVRLPDPVQQYGSAMSLAQLARQNRIGSMAEEEQSRLLSEQDAYRKALPALLAGNFSPEAVLAAVQNGAGTMAVSEADKRRKAAADEDKTRAETADKRAAAVAKTFDHLGGVAFAEAKAPDKLSLSRVNSIAERFGVPLPSFSGDPNDPAAVQGYLKSIATAGFAVKDQVHAAATDRAFDAGEVERMWRRQFDTGKQADTVEHQRNTEALTRRGQDVSASTARRGQDLLSDRAREANDIAAKAVPAATLREMAQNEVTLSKIDAALGSIKANPDALGLMNYMPDAIRQRQDPKGVETRAMVADLAGQKIHDRAGASQTVMEVARLRPYIPNQEDNPETATKKLHMLRREYQQLQHELASGKSLAEVVRARGGASGSFDGPADSDGGWSAKRLP